VLSMSLSTLHLRLDDVLGELSMRGAPATSGV
jgi:hypothetical protein